MSSPDDKYIKQFYLSNQENFPRRKSQDKVYVQMLFPDSDYGSCISSNSCSFIKYILHFKTTLTVSLHLKLKRKVMSACLTSSVVKYIIKFYSLHWLTRIGFSSDILKVWQFQNIFMLPQFKLFLLNILLWLLFRVFIKITILNPRGNSLPRGLSFAKYNVLGWNQFTSWNVLSSKRCLRQKVIRLMLLPLKCQENDIVDIKAGLWSWTTKPTVEMPYEPCWVKNDY